MANYVCMYVRGIIFTRLYFLSKKDRIPKKFKIYFVFYPPKSKGSLEPSFQNSMNHRYYQKPDKVPAVHELFHELFKEDKPWSMYKSLRIICKPHTRERRLHSLAHKTEYLAIYLAKNCCFTCFIL